jgi:hypothetical protein
MEKVKKDEVLGELASKQGRGDHVDSRLIASIREAESLYLFCLHDEDSFLSIIWQEINSTRLLTPKGQPRTLKEIGDRLRAWHGFPHLASALDLPSTEHCPSWFDRCIQIDKAFDYDHFGWISVVHPTDGERNQSPGGSFYIYDGAHRAVVLAKRLIAKESIFQPVTALLIVPRPT